jgi:hypothetical protein
MLNSRHLNINTYKYNRVVASCDFPKHVFIVKVFAITPEITNS